MFQSSDKLKHASDLIAMSYNWDFNFAVFHERKTFHKNRQANSQECLSTKKSLATKEINQFFEKNLKSGDTITQWVNGETCR